MDIIGIIMIDAHPAVISGKGRITHGPVRLVVCKSCGKDITTKDCKCNGNQPISRDRKECRDVATAAQSDRVAQTKANQE